MIERIFTGRNGIDGFSIFLLAVAMLFLPYRYTFIIAIVLIAYALFRCFSKNVVKRRTEAYRFQSIMLAAARFFAVRAMAVGRFFSFQSLKWRNRKTTVYFKCPKCKKRLSLPRHRGKLAVTCTVCGHEFIKKT